MKYISKIVAIPNGEVDFLNYDMWNKDIRFYVMVSDTEKPGVVVKVGGDMIPYRIDLLGFSDSALETCWSVVKNSAKTVLLHSFIESAVPSYAINSEALLNADSCLLYSGKQAHFTVGSRRDTLVVETINEAFQCFGKSGSVAVCRDKFSGVSQVMTLYDMLGRVCSLTGLNLMRYTSVYLVNKSMKSKSVVRFRHDSEADRYFTKMYFDVCGGVK